VEHLGRDSRETIVQRFADHVSSGKAEFFRQVGIDFIFGRREGPFVWDAVDGRRLINCHCNGGVFNLGHRHPQVVRALGEALAELDIGNHHLISEPRARLADRLARLCPGDMRYAVFGSGGGEAVDLALKLARGVTGRPNILSADGGYHGHTGLALATGDARYQQPFGPRPPGFSQLPFNDIEALEAAVDDDTAAVIFETVPATCGMPIAAPDFFRRAAQICRAAGALLIVDEVQTGLGRTGRFWGIEHFDAQPDILVVGKGLSGGLYPISATCFGPGIEAFFRRDPFIHVSTFGGAELGCPAALEVLEISSRPEFLSHVNRLAGQFAAGMERLGAKYPRLVRGLRQLGLMMGIETTTEAGGPVLTKTCYDNGLLCIYANNAPWVCQLLPPLIITTELAGEILDRLDRSLEQAAVYLDL
jgi:acetylornithine/succinyldiaminopimelate/putrescine aminotransferase